MKLYHKIIALTLLVIALLISAGMIYWKGWDYFVLDMTFGNPKDHDAYAGNLVIPSVDIDLPCLEMIVTEYDLAEQAVDKIGCAEKMWVPFSGDDKDMDPENGNGIWIFGDHDFQGFDAIMECKEGDMVYFMNKDGSIQSYIVVHTHEGAECGGTYLDREGKQFAITEGVEAMLMTCHPNGDLPYERDDRRFFVCLERIEE